MIHSQQCPTCHSSNPKEAQFCKSCGNSLVREIRFKKSFFLCNRSKIKILGIVVLWFAICAGLSISLEYVDHEAASILGIIGVFSTLISIIYLLVISVFHLFKNRVFYLDQSFDKELIKRVCHQNKYSIKELKNGDLVILFHSMARSGDWKIEIREMDEKSPFLIGETQAVKSFISAVWNKEYNFLEVE